MPRYKHPKVIERKLGKERADGIMNYEHGIIYIDVRLRGKRKLGTMIHEFTHYRHPDWTEDMVLLEELRLTDFLWKHGFRFVDNKKE